MHCHAPPGDLPDPGMEPVSLTSPALAGGFFTTGATWEALRGVMGKYQKERASSLCGMKAAQVRAGTTVHR